MTVNLALFLIFLLLFIEYAHILEVDLLSASYIIPLEAWGRERMWPFIVSPWKFSSQAMVDMWHGGHFQLLPIQLSFDSVPEALPGQIKRPMMEVWLWALCPRLNYFNKYVNEWMVKEIDVQEKQISEQRKWPGIKMVWWYRGQFSKKA